MNPEATVFVVDDDQELCRALQWLLTSDGLKVEVFHSADEFLEQYDPQRPGVLVLDVRMRGMSGLELQNVLCERGYPIPVIILTGHGDVPMAVSAVKAGAYDFLQKPVNDAALLNRISGALRLDEQRRHDLEKLQVYRKRYASLTPRERQVFELVVGGMANKQIACDLCLSAKTVEVHRKNLMRKVGVQSVVELMRVAFVLGVKAATTAS